VDGSTRSGEARKRASEDNYYHCGRQYT